MTDSILDEFDDGRPAHRLPRDIRAGNDRIASQRARFGDCCGVTAQGESCRRIGVILRAGQRSYCRDHDPVGLR